MKVYMYDAESGLYEGETFEDEYNIKYVDGLTSIVPPSHDKGMVPVFNQGYQVWSIVPIAELKKRISSSQQPTGDVS